MSIPLFISPLPKALAINSKAFIANPTGPKNARKTDFNILKPIPRISTLFPACSEGLIKFLNHPIRFLIALPMAMIFFSPCSVNDPPRKSPSCDILVIEPDTILPIPCIPAFKSLIDEENLIMPRQTDSGSSLRNCSLNLAISGPGPFVIISMNPLVNKPTPLITLSNGTANFFKGSIIELTAPLNPSLVL